ncbi:hypothetical protein Tco_0838779 [Tanacetum coccineum]|uniref:Reverse transcriptase Ty1/copia-type domain-containing protein n=1 Tax=Tanacetum coccineum TaxID=301880 RepID=A0ABQ5ARZ9_9ASTR
MNNPSKEDLDNLFGPMFEEYYEQKSSDIPIYSAAQQTQVHEDSPSTSSIIVDMHEAPPVVTTSDDQTSPISLTKADEFNQEDTADFDGNAQFVPYNPPSHKEIESSTTALEPSNLWKNKCDAEIIMVRNKTRLVAKGYKQGGRRKKAIDFKESFAPVAHHVYRLKKALYDLKQASRAWYGKLSSFLIEHGFTKGTPTDQTTYRHMIGGLMYLTASRPDIAFATFVCARYQARPTVKHLKEVKRIFRYLRQSYNMGLWYPKDSGFELIAYSDADHAGCKDDCKSTSGGLQFLGGKLMSWSSKKQDCTAMSTAEAEYVSLSACCAQVIWMRTQLLDYGYKYNRIPMYCDSKSAIAISCNPVQHSKTKHIDIRYHFIKEHVEKGTVEIYFVGTEYQLADLFTKALPKERFEYLVHRIGMRCMTPKQLRSLTKLSS